jgi:uncharacterized membrane protein (DUF2068 family)
MRLVPRRWHNETWICSIRGHFAPAARAARLREEDAPLGRDAGDGTRFVRCLRCDLWSRAPVPEPAEAAWEVIPPLEQMRLPRRGKALEDAIVIRLIALDRGVHAVLFTVLAGALFLVQSRLPGIQEWAESLVEALREPIGSTGGGGHTFLSHQLERLMDLKKGQVEVLLATAVAYAVIEGIEAVYLWKEKRWAEYLTVLATLGFVPFEVHELVHRVTAPRVLALLVNVAVLVWLSWKQAPLRPARRHQVAGGDHGLESRARAEGDSGAAARPVDGEAREEGRMARYLSRSAAPPKRLDGDSASRMRRSSSVLFPRTARAASSPTAGPSMKPCPHMPAATK